MQLTVIIPIYNAEAYLEEALGSLREAKTRPDDIEIIVVDGGSTDSTHEILKRESALFSHVIMEPDNGQSDAINKGIKYARGRFFCWLNGDDFFLAGWNKVVEFLEECEDRSLVTSNSLYVDEHSCVKKANWLWGNFQFFLKRGVFYMTPPGVFFPTQLTQEIGLLNDSLKLSMDVELWYRLLRCGVKVRHYSMFLGAFRFHPHSLTVKDKATHAALENSETTHLSDYFSTSTQCQRVWWRRLALIWRAANLSILISLISRLRYMLKGL